MANETLYLNRKDGFAGYGLKKDEAIEKCSNLDEIIVFGKDGLMKVIKLPRNYLSANRPCESVFSAATKTRSIIWCTGR